MVDERQSTSKKRKGPVADSDKKPPKKKVKANTSKAIVDSPALSSVSSPIPNLKTQRQRRPPQRNASPGPSTNPIQQTTKSSSSASTKKRVRSPNPVESDWSPPPVSSLKSGRVPKPTPKSLANIPSKPSVASKKPKRSKSSSVKRQKTIPAASTTEVIELSSSEDENEPSPIPKRKPPKPTQTRLTIPRRKPPIVATTDIIDLCSDEDGRRRTAKSSPVRTKLENNVTVILSSDDETQRSDSETKSRRPARLKKPTLKAQASLNGKDAANTSETQVSLPPAEENVQSVSTKRKRSRPSRATSPSIAATPDGKCDPVESAKSPSPPVSDNQNTAGPAGEIDNQSFAGDAGVADDEAAEIQQAIYDSLMQEPSGVNDAVPTELTGEDGDVHDGDKQARVGDVKPQSLPTQPPLDTEPPAERPSTPAPTSLHLSANPSDLNPPLSELNAHVESPGPPVPKPESHPVSDTIPNTDPALQDAILLSLIWTEDGMENDVANAVAPSVVEPSVTANVPIVPSGEPKDEPVSAASDHENHVENTIAHTPARPSTPLFVADGENEDQEMQDALYASFSQDGAEADSLDPAIPTPLFIPDNAGHENEDMWMQNALLASLTQTETGTETGTILAADIPHDPIIADSSSRGLMLPVPYSQTVDPDDTSPYLPPHLSYAPPPLPDIYGEHEDNRSVSPGGGKELAVGDLSALGAGIVEQPALVPVVEDSELRLNEPNTEVVSQVEESAQPVPVEEDENEDVQVQRALLQSLSLNEDSSEERGADRSGVNGEEYRTDSNPIPTISDPAPPSPTSTPSPPEHNVPAEDIISEVLKTSPKPSLQLSTCHTTPDTSSSSLNGPLSSPTKLSQAFRKPTLPTYSSSPPTALPRLLTPRFFAQSFLPPICRIGALKAQSSPAMVEGPPPQSEPQPFEHSRHSSLPPPVIHYVSPRYEEDDPKMMEGLEAIQMSLETDLLSNTFDAVQLPSVVYQESPSEEAEEAEVDLELTNAESLENDPALTAAFTEALLLTEMFKDVQGCGTGSLAGNQGVNPEYVCPNTEQPEAENTSWPSLGLDSSGNQPSSEQPKQPVKSLSESSLDSLATIEDSPAPTTPVQLGYHDFDPSLFFIRSTSPMNFDHDILKDFMEVSVSPSLDKDDDAYLLSTHSFDYPDDVDVVV